jgi:hypothetical protein
MSKPLGHESPLGKLLNPDLKPGEGASVLSLPHQGHIDATFYQKGPDGRIRPVDKVHLDPTTYKPIK